METGSLSIARALLAGSLAAAFAGQPSASSERERVAETRAGIVAGLHAVFERLDTDRDSRVSRAEWNVSIETMMTLRLSDPIPLDNEEELRRDLQQIFDVEDADGDGHLTLTEMLATPMVTFTCMDANGDDVLTQVEIFMS